MDTHSCSQDTLSYDKIKTYLSCISPQPPRRTERKLDMFSLHFIEKNFHWEECSIKEFEEFGSCLLLYVEFTSAASRCPYCHHEILDISPKRTTLELIRYFSQFPRAERLKVKFVAMDLSPLFRKVIKTMFPGATIIGDQFHIQRLVIWALERVRKNVQKSFNEKRIYFKRNKHILNKKRWPSDRRSTCQPSEDFEAVSRITEILCLKRGIFKVFSIKKRSSVASFLSRWLALVKGSDVEEFKSVIKTFSDWKAEILEGLNQAKRIRVDLRKE